MMSVVREGLSGRRAHRCAPQFASRAVMPVRRRSEAENGNVTKLQRSRNAVVIEQTVESPGLLVLFGHGQFCNMNPVRSIPLFHAQDRFE